MMDPEKASNGAETRALSIQLEGVLAQRQIIAVRLALDGEVAATGTDRDSAAIWYE